MNNMNTLINTDVEPVEHAHTIGLYRWHFNEIPTNYLDNKSTWKSD